MSQRPSQWLSLPVMLVLPFFITVIDCLLKMVMQSSSHNWPIGIKDSFVIFWKICVRVAWDYSDLCKGKLPITFDSIIEFSGRWNCWTNFTCLTWFNACWYFCLYYLFVDPMSGFANIVIGNGTAELLVEWFTFWIILFGTHCNSVPISQVEVCNPWGAAMLLIGQLIVLSFNLDSNVSWS